MFVKCESFIQGTVCSVVKFSANSTDVKKNLKKALVFSLPGIRASLHAENTFGIVISEYHYYT
jgi:hypothetical protein